MFQEDPFDRFCCMIDATLTYLSVLIITTLQLEAGLLRIRLKWLTIKTGIELRLLWNHIQFRLQRVWNHLYWGHIHIFLVLIGAQQELTWTEIERRRVAAFTLYGVEIPRSPELDAGLKQEQILSQQ